MSLRDCRSFNLAFDIMKQDSFKYGFNDTFYWVKIGYIVSIIALLSSCSGTKNLLQEQQVLGKNAYRIITDDNKVDKVEVRETLTNLVRQEPVNKNWLNPRTWGTPVTIYDRLLTMESAESFQKYLRNREGFYQAEVTFQEEERNKYVDVVYTIDLGKRMYISSFRHQFEDTIMQRIMATYDGEIEVEIGAPLEARSFEREKVRMVQVLKNEGYADFNDNYIDIGGDSSNYKVDAIIYVYNPINKDRHTRYKIGDVNIYTEHNRSSDPYYQSVDTMLDKNYYSKTDRFLVKPSAIEDVIAINSGDLFNKSAETKMNLNLSRLAPYRFAVVDSYVDNDTTDIYNYNIFLSPFQNKWVMNSGVNLFYSSINTIAGQNLFGFTGNLGFQNRNYRNRAIRHSIGLEGTLEFNFPDFPKLSNVLTNTLSLNLNNRFDIPKVVDIFKITRFLNRLNVISDEALDNVSANGTTSIDMSGGYTSILNFYDLLSVNASWSYNFQPNPRLKYTIRQIGVNLINTNIDSVFQTNILDDNPLLERSFDPYLFTGFFFRELSMFKQSKETPGGAKFLFFGNFEISGLENFLANGLVNLVSGYDDKWKIGSSEFAQFVRLEADLRYNKRVKDRSSFVARLNTAIAVPFANDGTVPYVKQYFVGGPNSVRGWQLRELGPGTHQEQRLTNTAFFQTGDLKMEFNLEYRFDLFWYLEGALFLDGGNVWLLNEDVRRPGAQISWNFLDEMALSTGWGIRLDFDYFIFRFDFGYKLRNPFPDPETGSQVVLTNGNYNNLLGNINFAINYPF